MPRGWALGVTWQLPEFDAISQYKKKMLNDLSILFGGRIAEEVFLDQMSTGASNDFERATALARAMVTKYGMSESLGVMVYEDNPNDGMLGIKSRSISESTQQKVDEEVRRILEAQYKIARDLIEANKPIVEAMTDALMKWETINRDQVVDIVAGREPKEVEVITPVEVIEPKPSKENLMPPPLPAT